MRLVTFEVSCLTFDTLQVTCISLLHVSQALAERETAKVAAFKTNSSSSCSSSSSSSSSSSISSCATAYDIQSTMHVAAVLQVGSPFNLSQRNRKPLVTFLQRLMLLFNIISPAAVIRCCQVKCSL